MNIGPADTRAAGSAMLLAGDLGGTKTDLALYTPAVRSRLPHAQAEFRSAGCPNLVTMVREFLGRVNLPVDRACFAVGGPVMAGQAKITNLPWLIDAASDAFALILTDSERDNHGQRTHDTGEVSGDHGPR